MYRLFVTCLSGWLLCAATVTAQDDRRDQRRELVEGLLRTLVESQLKVRPQPPATGRPPAPDPRLRDVHATLGKFSEELGQVIQELRQEAQLSPGLRPVLGDVLQVKAACDVILQRASFYNEQQLAVEFQRLDRDWRVVSHRLRQTPNLDRHFLEHLDELNGLDARLCELLRVEPQLDRTELVRVAAVLEQDLRHLIDDLAVDLRGRRDAYELLGEGRRLIAQIRTVGTSAASNANNATIVAQYREFYSRWRNFAAAIRSLRDSHVERTVRSIARSNHELHDLLWLSREVDRRELQALTQTLAESVQQMSRAVTLSEVLALRDPVAAVADTQELLTSCLALARSVGGSEPLDDLVWDFRIMEVEWQEVRTHFQVSKNSEVHRQLAIAGQAIAILRESLGQEMFLDQQTIIALAADLDDLTDEILHDVTRYIGSSRHAPPFRGQAMQSAQMLQQSTRRLHALVAEQAGDDALRSQSGLVAQQFEQFGELVNQFEPPLREQLQLKFSRARPALAKLQLLYAY